MLSEFLTSTLGVPPIQITNLRDRAATKKSIEQAIKNLGDDKIPEDAALLIFFAGHGAEVDAPANYPSGHVKGKIQMLLPHDFTPQAKADEITHGQGLLDIEFARLLRELALKKSNNIVCPFRYLYPLNIDRHHTDCDCGFLSLWLVYSIVSVGRS